MPEVLDWPREHGAEMPARVAQVLQQGSLVAVPTDTVYTVLAHGLMPDALRKLRRLPGVNSLAIAVDGIEDVRDWLPDLDGLGLRLPRHCWPGPLTLSSAAGSRTGLATRLPAEVQSGVFDGDHLAVHAPGHPCVGLVRRALAGPVVMAEIAGLVGPEETATALGDELALLVNDGRSYFGGPSSVVRVDGRRWQMLRQGVVTPEMIAELVVCRILFVCTGNTCRSPLAMALCGKLLADRLGCEPGQLRERGFEVHSAGIAAIMGAEASAEAIDVAREMGSALLEHRSQPLTAEMLARTDRLFAMTRNHLRFLSDANVAPGTPLRLLSARGEDVFDPIGADAEVYRECAQQILDCLRERLPEMVEA